MTKAIEGEIEKTGVHALNLNHGPRIAREKKTIGVMISIYCYRFHGRGSELCDDCRQLLDYAEKRLDRCPFKDKKTTCASCTIHCYKSDMRQKVRKVMRYSGPRMAYCHPVLAFHHLKDSCLKLKGGFKK